MARTVSGSVLEIVAEKIIKTKRVADSTFKIVDITKCNILIANKHPVVIFDTAINDTGFVTIVYRRQPNISTYKR